MKRSLKASGLLSALSLSLFGVSVVGCAAEVTPAGEALGTTSQAYTGTFTPTTALVGAAVPNDLQFSGEFKIAENKILVVGGYNKAGTAQPSAGIITNTAAATGTWLPLIVSNGSSTLSPMPTALGEAEITKITTNVYLVAGGRTARDGAASTKAWILTLSGTSGNIATWTSKDMSQARVIGKNNLQKCGNASHFIAVGGVTDDGMNDTGISVTPGIEVFHYDFTTPANSAWAKLFVTGDSNRKVYLPEGRGYHAVLSASLQDFRIAGGAGSADALDTVRKLPVNSTCTEVASTNVDNVSMSSVSATIKTTLSTTPIGKTSSGGTGTAAPRARMAWIQPDSAVTINGTSYDFILAGGNDATTGGRFSTAPPTRVLYYRSASDAWYDDSSAKAVATGRLYPRLVDDDTNQGTVVKFGTGVIGDGTNASTHLLYNTPTATSLIALGTGAVTAGTAMANGRVGAPVQLLTTGGNADFAAFGTKYPSSLTGTALADVEDF
jgi:hypothetical protein